MFRTRNSAQHSVMTWRVGMAGGSSGVGGRGQLGGRLKSDGIYILFSHVQEKAMAPHSSTLAWKIPWTEEPGRL